jgi:hypothetical protein
MVPIPQLATWDVRNAHLEEQCLRRQADVLRGQSEMICQRLVRDLAAMSDLPAAPFEACKQAAGRVSSQALVRYKGSSVKKSIRGIDFSVGRLLGARRLRPPRRPDQGLRRRGRDRPRWRGHRTPFPQF